MCNVFLTSRRDNGRSRLSGWFGQFVVLAILGQPGSAMAQGEGVAKPAGEPPPIPPAAPREPAPNAEGVKAPPVPEPAPAFETPEPKIIVAPVPPPNAPPPPAPEPPAGVVVEPAPEVTSPREPYKPKPGQRDTTGLVPYMPPGPAARRAGDEVKTQLEDLIETVQDPEAEISLVVGQTKLIRTRKPLTRIAVANPIVADVSLLSDETPTRSLNLFGRSFGTTTLTFWDADNRPVTFLVRVTLDTPDLEARIKQTFPGANVHVRQVGPQVILEGQVPDAKTMADILQLVTMELRNSVAQRAQAGAAGAGGAGAAGGAGGATTGATGAGGAPGGAAPMAGGAAPGGGAAGGGAGGVAGTLFTIINRVVVPGPRQVLLHVKIAELNRTAIRQLGVSWLDTRNNAILGQTLGGAATFNNVVGGATQTSATNARGQLSRIASTFNSAANAAPGPNAQLFGVFNAGQFNLFLNALRSNALAKILAEPNLMALDGQPARFLAGGLFPYPVPQSSSIPGGTAVVTVQFANFGAILSFLPNILPNDVIRLDVEPVFSKLNFAGGTTINGGKVPAIDQRSARTVVELREGQTLAIAGLLQTTTNSATVRIPGLGDLPIVGPWFSTNVDQIIETELVVLVTPELVAPMEANEVPPAPGDRVYMPNDWEFYFLGRIEGKLGRPFRGTVAEHDPLNVMKHFQSENRWVVGPHGHSD